MAYLADFSWPVRALDYNPDDQFVRDLCIDKQASVRTHVWTSTWSVKVDRQGYGHEHKPASGMQHALFTGSRRDASNARPQVATPMFQTSGKVSLSSEKRGRFFLPFNYPHRRSDALKSL